MLGIVQQQKYPVAKQPINKSLQHRPPLLLDHTQRLYDSREGRGRLTDGRERDPPHTIGIAVGHLSGDLQCKPGLPSSPRPREGYQPRVLSSHDGGQFPQLIPPTEKRGRRHGEVRPRQATKRRKLTLAKLKQPLGRSQILQAVLAQVTNDPWQQHLVDQGPRRGGKHHLTPMGRRGDPSRTVDIEPHIALFGQQRRTRVHPHPHTHASGSERGLDLSSRSQSATRSREDQERAITLPINNPTAVRSTPLVNDPAKRREPFGPPRLT